MISSRRSFITGIKSIKLSSKERSFLKKFKPWGVILFSRNIKSINQVYNLTKEIRKIFKDKKYPILLDQEGGRVNRLKKFINADLFSNKFFGDLYLKDKKKFNNYYKIYIDKTSYLLKQIGININTVPVLDIRNNGSSKIIGDRSFSNKIDVINDIGNIWIKSFHNNNIGTVIKHIPGHGLAKVDSHLLTPFVNKKIKYLMKNDFSTFRSKKSFFAMTAHIIYREIDNLVLHCNGKFNEMMLVAKNSPIVDKFIVKKTSQFYKILS